MKQLLILILFLSCSLVYSKTVFINCTDPNDSKATVLSKIELSRLFINKNYQVIFDVKNSERKYSQDIHLTCLFQNERLRYKIHNNGKTFYLKEIGPAISAEDFINLKKEVDIFFELHSTQQQLKLLPKTALFLRSDIKARPVKEPGDYKVTLSANSNIAETPPVTESHDKRNSENKEPDEPLKNIELGFFEKYKVFAGIGITPSYFKGISDSADSLGFYFTGGFKSPSNTIVYSVDFYNQFWVKGEESVARSNAYFIGFSREIRSFFDDVVAVRSKLALGYRGVDTLEGNYSGFAIAPNISVVFLNFLEVGLRMEYLDSSKFNNLSSAHFIQISYKY